MQWTPSRILHLCQADEVEYVCKVLNAQDKRDKDDLLLEEFLNRLDDFFTKNSDDDGYMQCEDSDMEDQLHDLRMAFDKFCCDIA